MNVCMSVCRRARQGFKLRNDFTCLGKGRFNLKLPLYRNRFIISFSVSLFCLFFDLGKKRIKVLLHVCLCFFYVPPSQQESKQTEPAKASFVQQGPHFSILGKENAAFRLRFRFICSFHKYIILEHYHSMPLCLISEGNLTILVSLLFHK